MNKDICKYINNCGLCKRKKARTQVYPLQMTHIPYRSFDKIAIDLVSDLNISASGKSTHIDYHLSLNGMARGFPSLTRKQTPLSASSSIITCLFTCALPSYCQTMELNSRTSWWTMFSSNMALTASFLPCTTHKVMEN